MKSITLLAIALFLASAPSPDADTISQISGNFLSPGNDQPLLAAEPGKPGNRIAQVVSEAPAEELHSQTAKQLVRVD